ncbi:MAG: transketolase [Spirochaetales bacterium]
MLSLNELEQLKEKAKEIRRLTLQSIASIGVGHVGGSLSLAEVLAYLYFYRMRVDPQNPRNPDRDVLVLSKGHAGPALYATLALKGYFPIDWLHTLNKGGTNLPSHADRNKTPGVDMTAGSLGQGLSAAVGMALADRLSDKKVYTYAIVGDGESNEGQIWEAAMTAAHYKLGRLIVFTDYNKMQIDGYTKEIMNLDDIVAKWRAFNWHVQRVDGHNIEAIDAAVTLAQLEAAAPSMIILDTIKGKGVSWAEGKVGSHNMPVTQEMLALALTELN